jgi:hypothetical protein
VQVKHKEQQPAGQGKVPHPVFDFDAVEVWGPRLQWELVHLLPPNTASKIASTKHEFVEDAHDQLLEIFGPGLAELFDRITEWLQRQSVAAYHGSRLTAQEVAGIKREGLKPLCGRHRISRLVAMLSAHPDWDGVEPKLEAAVDAFGRDGVQTGYGKREGQVHATLSRAGLVHSFNHYLYEGSEFDTNVARYLLKESGISLVTAFGQPHVFHLHVPGRIAVEANNPYQLGEAPMLREIMKAWAWWLANKVHSSASLRIDCGLRFESDIPPAWIAEIEKL